MMASIHASPPAPLSSVTPGLVIVRGATITADTLAPDLNRCPTVIVVDNDPDVRDSLTVLLEAHGFPVRTYAAGDLLLADAARSRAGCFVIDQHMPGMDGLETVARLNEEGISAPVILITGWLEPRLRTRAAKLGVAAILEKPFVTGQLVRLLQDYLQPPR